jgi:hypothetical protein
VEGDEGALDRGALGALVGARARGLSGDEAVLRALVEDAAAAGWVAPTILLEVVGAAEQGVEQGVGEDGRGGFALAAAAAGCGELGMCGDLRGPPGQVVGGGEGGDQGDGFVAVEQLGERQGRVLISSGFRAPGVAVASTQLSARPR